MLLELRMDRLRGVEAEVVPQLEGVAHLPAVAQAEDVELILREKPPGAVELSHELGGCLDGRAVVFKGENELGFESFGDLGHASRDSAIGSAGGLVAELLGNRSIRVIEVLKPDHGLIHGLSEICRTMSLKSGTQSIVRSPRDNSQPQR